VSENDGASSTMKRYALTGAPGAVADRAAAIADEIATRS
jgi:hypothetical protein